RHSRLVALATAVLFSLTSSGCMTSCREYISNGFKVGPNYCKPAAPISENWIDSHDSRLSNQPPQDGAWWRGFQDPILDSLIADAYAQNLTLREAGFRVIEARALRAIAVGDLFPQSQTAFGSYSR